MNIANDKTWQRVTKFLSRYTLPIGKGYDYIKTCLCIIIDSNFDFGTWTSLYKKVAEQKQARKICVEKNIRYFIENAWHSFKLFDVHPTNSIFLLRCAEIICLDN